MAQEKRANPVITVLVLTPLVIAPLVLLGAYLGFYVGDVTGLSRTLLAIAFSTAGFLASIAILVKVIARIVAKSSWAKK